MLPNKAMHRMSGTHICSRFGWRWIPLIGDLNRCALSHSAPDWSTMSQLGSANCNTFRGRVRRPYGPRLAFTARDARLGLQHLNFRPRPGCDPHLGIVAQSGPPSRILVEPLRDFLAGRYRREYPPAHRSFFCDQKRPLLARPLSAAGLAGWHSCFILVHTFLLFVSDAPNKAVERTGSSHSRFWCFPQVSGGCSPSLTLIVRQSLH
jgi:hypothetical protein